MYFWMYCLTVIVFFTVDTYIRCSSKKEAQRDQFRISYDEKNNYYTFGDFLKSALLSLTILIPLSVAFVMLGALAWMLLTNFFEMLQSIKLFSLLEKESK